MTEAAEDGALLPRSAQGDQAAFDLLMERHAEAVYRFLISLGAAPVDAEDLLQESFIAAWRGAGGYSGSGTVRGWLFAIARNAFRQRIRRRIGEPAHHERLESLEALGARAGWGVTSDLAERIEQEAELDWALARLPEEEREAVVLRDIQGLSGEEAAHLLGVSHGALKSRLHRGRLRLMAVLRTEGGARV